MVEEEIAQDLSTKALGTSSFSGQIQKKALGRRSRRNQVLIKDFSVTPVASSLPGDQILLSAPSI